MKYMLDTNICSFCQDEVPSVVEKINEFQEGDLAISSIVYGELIFGIENSAKFKYNYERLQSFLTFVDIFPFDCAAAEHYSSIRFHLERHGMKIGFNDILIAAHALSYGIPLVTNNVREFERVPGLIIEDWSK